MKPASGVPRPPRSELPLKAAQRLAVLAPQWIAQGDEAVQRGEPADRWQGASYRQHRELGSRDRRFLSELLFSYFRWRGWINHIALPSPWPERALAAGVLEASEPHAALGVLASQTRHGRHLPIGHASPDLGAKARMLEAAFDIKGLDPSQLLPSWVESEFAAQADFAACRAAFQTRPPVWLRARRGSDELARTLHASSVSAEVHLRVGQAMRIEPGTNLSGHPLCGSQFMIQDLASQAVGLACAPEQGQRWWDACCGAGGKSFHLADLAHGDLHILATDTRGEMIHELNRRRRKAGIRCVEARVLDATAAAPQGLFDGVLLDAPCSGLGTWARNPDARWRTRRNTVEHAAETQQRILAMASQAVKPGGCLVYAVCSLAQRETEDSVQRFLAGHPDFVLSDFPHPLSGLRTGGQAWVLPFEHACNGMYIARMTRSPR